MAKKPTKPAPKPVKDKPAPTDKARIARDKRMEEYEL